MRGILALILWPQCLDLFLGLPLGVQMHLDRENIFAVGPDECSAMIRKLLVELERFWACDNDGSQGPIEEQMSFLRAIVSSGDVVK